MSKIEKEIKSWMLESLKSIGANDADEMIVDYIFGIISDDSDESEKVESIKEFISTLTEEDSDSFCKELSGKYKTIQQQKDEEIKVKQTTLKLEQELKIKEVSNVEKNDQQEQYENPYYKMTREEQKKRDAILSRYGYEEEVDENGDILIPDDTDKDKIELAKAVSILQENNNTKRILDAEKSQREKSKMDHQKKVLRDKEALEKQKRDDEKKKTVKKEKRRL
ncbi:hypothetical protein DLAC_07605 [Tieghemostelium lacteum]|uniref:CCDC43 PWI-like domain-containing protein n=1 Tax=Tieghemostelium lacteum TaxID=361077 RepID=A0A151ZCZ2_TIELA|nr:hypothetical protein DLAC_07605 [Tieghemostelium lacteum]|eukprot:KYQ91810.1 hypothetical protein DLAC_07605 [Tieghemostelium lacteum]